MHDPVNDKGKFSDMHETLEPHADGFEFRCREISVGRCHIGYLGRNSADRLRI